ncbi:MAG: hypothetical protein ACO35F_02600, partial [Ilumatobacteraceae bacterium]
VFAPQASSPSSIKLVLLRQQESDTPLIQHARYVEVDAISDIVSLSISTLLHFAGTNLVYLGPTATHGGHVRRELTST